MGLTLSEQPTKAAQDKMLRHLRRKQRSQGATLIEKKAGKWVLTETGVRLGVLQWAVDMLNKKPVG